MISGWNIINDLYGEKKQRLVWELCATIYWYLTSESDEEQNMMTLTCSFVNEHVRLWPFWRQIGESYFFSVLRIESNFRQYDALFEPGKRIYVHERGPGWLSSCVLLADINCIIHKISSSRDIRDDVYERDDDFDMTRIRIIRG